MNLTKDDRIIIAKALTLYKKAVKGDRDDGLKAYNRVEVANVDALAKRLDLDGDYYEQEPEPGEGNGVLTEGEVRELVRQIKAVQIFDRDMLEKIDVLTDKIKAGGWKLKVEAYSATVTRTNAGRALAKPRKEWRNVAHWVRGDEKVWYYNNKADSKAYAMDMASKSEVK